MFFIARQTLLHFNQLYYNINSCSCNCLSPSSVTSSSIVWDLEELNLFCLTLSRVGYGGFLEIKKQILGACIILFGLQEAIQDVHKSLFAM